MTDQSSLPRRLGTVVGRLIEAVTAVAVLLLMLQTVGNIVWRAVFDRPLANTNELSAYWYLPLIAFMGYIVAQNRSEHIEATLVYDRMGRRPQVEFQVVSRVVSALTLFFFSWFTLKEALHNREIGLLAGVSDLVVWPVTFVVPIAFLVLGVQLLVVAAKVVRTGDPHTATTSHDPAEQPGL